MCGDPAVNPAALAVRWWWDAAAGRVVGSFLPGCHHTGYADRLHGGLLAALFDEALAWACAVERRTFCYTGELKVRFKRPIPLGKPLELAAWVCVTRGPYLRAEGNATTAGGGVVATAAGTFATMPRDEALALQHALRLAPGDVNVLEEGRGRP